jgi:aspartyl-tRNA(Asn)/glutamyl-tRNA(Gln) amidotransferase subunit B
MNEGAFRCDVNLSIRKKGEKEFGIRTEMKNLNSFGFIVKAIESEAKRQIEVIKSGGKVVQETRRWDAAKGKSISMRSKENAHDYRYFPDPDLMPIVITKEKISALKEELPQLPDRRKKQYMDQYRLSAYDAEQLVASKEIADYFEQVAGNCRNVKMAANLIMTEIFRLLAEQGGDIVEIPIQARYIGQLVELIEEGIINSSMSKKVISEMWKTDYTPIQIIKEQGLEQINNDNILMEIAEKVIVSNQQAVADYLAGKEKAIQSLVGFVMKETKGKANPQRVRSILKDLLDEKNSM